MKKLKKLKILKIARNKLYLEGEEVLDVSPDIISQMELSKKKELSYEEYKRVTYLGSLAKSLFLLSRKDYTEKEMLTKLKQKYRETSALIDVVEKLKGRGFINDEDYARSYIGRSRDSKRKIEYNLSLKGISRELMADIFSEGEHDEKEEIRKQLRKVINKEKDKQIAYLMRKGFNYEDIREVLREE